MSETNVVVCPICDSQLKPNSAFNLLESTKLFYYPGHNAGETRCLMSYKRVEDNQSGKT